MKNVHAFEFLRSLSDVVYSRASPYSNKTKRVDGGSPKAANLKNFQAFKSFRALSDFVYCRASPYSKKLSGWTGGTQRLRTWKIFTPSNLRSLSDFVYCCASPHSKKTKRVDGGSSQAAGEAHLVSNFLSISLFLFPPSCSLLSLCTGSSCLARAGGHVQASGGRVFSCADGARQNCMRPRARAPQATDCARRGLRAATKTGPHCGADFWITLKSPVVREIVSSSFRVVSHLHRCS